MEYVMKKLLILALLVMQINFAMYASENITTVIAEDSITPQLFQKMWKKQNAKQLSAEIAYINTVKDLNRRQNNNGTQINERRERAFAQLLKADFDGSWSELEARKSKLDDDLRDLTEMKMKGYDPISTALTIATSGLHYKYADTEKEKNDIAIRCCNQLYEQYPKSKPDTQV
jgi:Spy/CpxP family protein refolding chaperone